MHIIMEYNVYNRHKLFLNVSKRNYIAILHQHYHIMAFVFVTPSNKLAESPQVSVHTYISQERKVISSCLNTASVLHCHEVF